LSTKRKERESHKLVPFPENVYEEFKESVEAQISVKSYKDSGKAEEEMVKSALYSSVRESTKIVRFDGNYSSFGDKYIAYRTLDRLGIARFPVTLLADVLKEYRRSNEESYRNLLAEVEKFGRNFATYLRLDGRADGPQDIMEFLAVLAPYLEHVNSKFQGDALEAVFKSPFSSEELSELTHSLLRGYFEPFGFSLVSFSNSGGILVVKAVRGKVLTANR
jgi:hypothetical protein